MTILHAMECHLGVISHIPEGVGRFHTWDHSTWTFRTTFSYLGPFVLGPFRSWDLSYFRTRHVLIKVWEGSDASRARTIRRLPSNPGSQGAGMIPPHGRCLCCLQAFYNCCIPD